MQEEEQKTVPSPSRRVPGAAELAAALVLFGSSVALADDPVSVTFIESFPVYDKEAKLTEPSGLTLSADGQHLWTVSDDSKHLFRLDFDGRVLESGKIRLPNEGAEGIALTTDGKQLLVVREEKNELWGIELSSGEVVFDRPLAELEGYEAVASVFEASPKNKGLEAIAVDSETGHVFLLKEGEPRMFLELSPDLDRLLGHLLLGPAQGFSETLSAHGDLDVSGLAYDPLRRLFWIVSDRGRRLFLFDWARKSATSTKLYATIDGEQQEVHHAEGVAYDPKAGRLYVVSDDGKDSRLFIFSVE